MAPFNCNRSRRSIVKLVVFLCLFLLFLQYMVNLVVYQRFSGAIYTMVNAYIGGENRGSLLPRLMASMTTHKQECPFIPPGLAGRVKVNIEISSWTYLEEGLDWLEPGGRWRPDNCTARHRVAIIVPYRDRDLHLKIFLQNIHGFLRRQQLDYGIFIVEMAEGVTFNRAILMNIGFIEASKAYDYQCFIFHDVDLLPEDDRNLYSCPLMPRHMSSAIDKLKYKLPYPQIFGGVSALTGEQFRKVNGFSNIFFGWGGEDDDMYRRIVYANLTVIRYSPEVARYKMLVHKKDKGNPKRFDLLKSSKLRRNSDGLTSLRYTLLKTELRKLYTWILVTVNETDIMKQEVVHSSVKAVPIKQKGKIVHKLLIPAHLKNLTLAAASDARPMPPRVISWVPDGAVAPTHLTIPNELATPKSGPKKLNDVSKVKTSSGPIQLMAQQVPPSFEVNDTVLVVQAVSKLPPNKPRS